MKSNAQFLTLLSGAALFLGEQNALGQQVTYIDATLTNTTLTDGTALPTPVQAATDDDLWDQRAFGNADFVFAANGAGDGPENAPRLRTTISGLVSGESYTITAYFWGNSTQQWVGRAGLTDDADDIPAYSSNIIPGDILPPMTFVTLHPGTGTNPGPRSLSGDLVGDARFENDNYFDTSTVKVQDNDDRLALYEVRIGTAVANPSGEVEVFIDDLGNATSNNRTWYDGVGFRIADTDNDGIADVWEVDNQLTVGIDDSAEDPDGDNLTNLVEFQNDTNPNLVDTDGDSLNDDVELAGTTSPILADTDGDGVEDAAELADGTNPNDPTSFKGAFEGVVAAFDFGPTNIQAGWTGAPLGNGSTGTVSVATEAIGGATLQQRDRGAVNTDGGDIENSGMWSDFLFARNSIIGSTDVGLRITLSGLSPNSRYPITIWAHDQVTVDVGGASMLWNNNSLIISGDDPTSLADPTAQVSVEVDTDATGTAFIDGFTGIEEPVGPTNNVFVNGLTIGDPLGSVGPMITSIVGNLVTGEVALTWNSRPGATYTVFTSTDLSTPITEWDDLTDSQESGGMQTTFIHATDLNVEKRRFYAIQTN